VVSVHSCTSSYHEHRIASRREVPEERGHGLRPDAVADRGAAARWSVRAFRRQNAPDSPISPNIIISPLDGSGTTPRGVTVMVISLLMLARLETVGVPGPVILMLKKGRLKGVGTRFRQTQMVSADSKVSGPDSGRLKWCRDSKVSGPDSDFRFLPSFRFRFLPPIRFRFLPPIRFPKRNGQPNRCQSVQRRQPPILNFST
jgi:hypothetical protein